jgi:hypothetical protein
MPDFVPIERIARYIKSGILGLCLTEILLISMAR